MNVLELLDHGIGMSPGGIGHRMDRTRCIRHGCKNSVAPDASFCDGCYQWARGETDVDPLGDRSMPPPLVTPAMPDSDDPAEWQAYRQQLVGSDVWLYQ